MHENEFFQSSTFVKKKKKVNIMFKNNLENETILEITQLQWRNL
jgi:hypothetical protein